MERCRDCNRYKGRHGLGRIVLTGLTKTKGHEFKLNYLEESGKEICICACKCGFETRLIYFQNYGGIKELERVWKSHTEKGVNK